MTKPKAYSYIRFSTPEQQKGDSKRRQTELARRYADANGLDLDETLTFHDLGVSAYRGKNRDAALGPFVTTVEAGRVKQGSYLLVESLDRLSRGTRPPLLDLEGLGHGVLGPLLHGLHLATHTAAHVREALIDRTHLGHDPVQVLHTVADAFQEVIAVVGQRPRCWPRPSGSRRPNDRPRALSISASPYACSNLQASKGGQLARRYRK